MILAMKYPPRFRRLLIFACLAALTPAIWPQASPAAERVLDGHWRCFRSGAEREWSDFPEQAAGARLELTFKAEANASPWTLRLRQRDVRKKWRLHVNGKQIGALSTDENPLTSFWELPAGALQTGENTLEIAAADAASDDVYLGDVRLIDRPRAEVLNSARLKVLVVDGDAGQPMPARITIIDEHETLMTVGATSGGKLAVRPGAVYTADGRAEFGLPAGKYQIVAGRAFEYGIDSREIELAEGQQQELRLAIRRETPMPGYASCDTHVHTWTFSRHGDATLEERLITLAGEGVELPIATDHNLQIDYEPAARAAGLREHFTPVVGNEVTSRFGHFNVFPLDPAAPPVAHDGRNWNEIFATIGRGQRRVLILNHPHDIHSGFRPFDPQRHVAVAGENLDGWKLEANAMELVNSGALQSDGQRLIADWFGLLNAGFRIAPVGSSDSHDVSRSIVGQARTYVRCRDDDAGMLDASEAVDSFLAGRVLVSFGLAADVLVNGKYGPGDVAPLNDLQPLDITARVWGPAWSAADYVALYINGKETRRETIPDKLRLAPGLKYEVAWTLPHPQHDVHLAVVAFGPGIDPLYWPTQRPYQSSSPEWRPYSLGITGAVWIDADGGPGVTSAREYALRLVNDANGDAKRLIKLLQPYDEATAVQVAAELWARGQLFAGSTLDALLDSPAAATRAGVRQYVEAWKASEAARR
jgi:hypothetical protein